MEITGVDPDAFMQQQLDDAEDMAEGQVEAQTDASVPFAQDTFDKGKLFWKVVKTTDSSKVGNLDKTELGALDISVRDCKRIAELGYMLGHNGFGDYFSRLAEITLSTSASKDGWLPELFVTSKVERTKKRGGNPANLNNAQSSNKGGVKEWFKKAA